MANPTLYNDMLELHALRAPLGPYRGEYSEESDADGMVYNLAIQDAVEAFESKYNVEIFLLGRSGRHVCIEDTPRNRRRYSSLQAKAVTAVRGLWEHMRTW